MIRIFGVCFVACIAAVFSSAAERGFPAGEQTEHSVLGRGFEPGQAVVCYLFHSGWAVKTKNHLLIFDCTEPPVPPSIRALASGTIDPAEIGGQNVTVFVSHGHSDHFDPRILEWRAAVQKIRYVWGWEEGGSSGEIRFGRDRRTVKEEGLEISNIHYEFDGIPESAFLVKTDGLAILHAGDHGHSQGMGNPTFKENLLYLAAKAPRLDILFTPTFGGEIEAIKTLNPSVVFPMHDGGYERQYAKFAAKVKALGLDVAVGAAGKAGDRFFYSRGRLSSD